jgi:hypothetical protein
VGGADRLKQIPMVFSLKKVAQNRNLTMLFLFGLWRHHSPIGGGVIGGAQTPSKKNLARA